MGIEQEVGVQDDCVISWKTVRRASAIPRRARTHHTTASARKSLGHLVTTIIKVSFEGISSGKSLINRYTYGHPQLRN